MAFAQINQMGALMAAPQRPANPFADNAEFIALREYEQSLGPTEDELARLNELRTAFTSSDAYQSHLQEQQQRQQMLAQQRSQMGGIMGMAPFPMQQRVPMMQHPMQVGGYGAPSPQMQMGGNSMQMLIALLSQVFGGGGMGRQMGGGYQQAYGQVPQMQQVYAPQQHYSPPQDRQQRIYDQPQNMQQQVYAQPQQASPFGGATRGYYA